MKKAVAAILSSALILTSMSNVFGLVMPSEGMPAPEYSSFKGEIKEVTPYYEDEKEVEGQCFVLTENDEGETFNFHITEETYYITDNPLKAGAVIEGFYNINAPALMIYPPQRVPIAIAVDLPEGTSVKIDSFDENLTSSDNQLKLNISDDTVIVLQNNEPFDGELTNRTLIVLYDVTTRSIPAQTNPQKVVVLYEKAVPPIYYLTDEEKESLIGLGLTGEAQEGNAEEELKAITVEIDGKEFEPFTKEDGTVMVPVMPIAEALGYKVRWDAETQMVTLNNTVSLTIGKDYYTYMRMAPIELGHAPEIVNNRTFVPITFFTDVMMLNSVDLNGNEIIVTL